MPNNEPKVFYGLSNVHYAKLTEITDPETGVVTSSYGQVKKWPGAVNIALSPSGAPVIFSADNSAYYTISNNRGYEGDFESAKIPDDIHVDVNGEHLDDKGFIVETDKDEVSYFALMFEFETDVNPNRYVFYKVCLASRPEVSSETVDVNGDITPKTNSVSFKAMPQTDVKVIDGKQCHLVKAFTGANVDQAAYNNFYQSVYIPTFEGGES